VRSTYGASGGRPQHLCPARYRVVSCASPWTPPADSPALQSQRGREVSRLWRTLTSRDGLSCLRTDAPRGVAGTAMSTRSSARSGAFTVAGNRPIGGSRGWRQSDQVEIPVCTGGSAGRCEQILSLCVKCTAVGACTLCGRLPANVYTSAFCSRRKGRRAIPGGDIHESRSHTSLERRGEGRQLEPNRLQAVDAAFL
jgi:hypothetical protein